MINKLRWVVWSCGVVVVAMMWMPELQANPSTPGTLRANGGHLGGTSTQPTAKNIQPTVSTVYSSMVWTPLNFEQAVQQAQQQKRWLFIDMYATWCYPCKRYDHEVFSKSEVATYMHQYFIPLRRNGYQGEGNLLRRRYNCVTFPCLLVVNEQGEEVERITKFYGASEFLTVIKQIQQGKNTLAAIEQQWKQQPQNHTLRFVLGSRLAYRGDARCVDHLRAVANQPPPEYPHLAGQALYVLARIYYRNTRHDWSSTAATLRELLRRFPQHNRASQAQNLLRDALRRMRRTSVPR